MPEKPGFWKNQVLKPPPDNLLSLCLNWKFPEFNKSNIELVYGPRKMFKGFFENTLFSISISIEV